MITHKFISGIHGNEVWLYEIVNGPHSWANDDLNTEEEIRKFLVSILGNLISMT